MFELYYQTGEVPTKRKNKAYAVIKNEMEERERAKKRQSKNMVSFDLFTSRMTHGWFSFDLLMTHGWLMVYEVVWGGWYWPTPEMLRGRSTSP